MDKKIEPKTKATPWKWVLPLSATFLIALTIIITRSKSENPRQKQPNNLASTPTSTLHLDSSLTFALETVATEVVLL